MPNSESENPSNNPDTSSESQEVSASNPSNSSSSTNQKVFFTSDDMATSNLSEDTSNIQTFTTSEPSESDE